MKTSIARLYPGRFWQALSTTLCFLFGLVLVFNIHPIGDGQWFWYAALFRGGQRLYSGMHLSLQPFFILLSGLSQHLLGNGWLASKLLAVLQLAVYLAGLSLVARRTGWRDGGQALLIAAVFGLSMGAIYFRFDDYHVTVFCLEIWSILLLLRLHGETRTAPILCGATILGWFAGICMSNRLNDGAALLVACGFLLPFFLRRARAAALLCFSVAAFATLFGVIALTGDSLHDWALYTIIHGAQIKGGTGHVLTAPLRLPLAMLEQLADLRRVGNLVYAGLLIWCIVRIDRFRQQPETRVWTWQTRLTYAYPVLTFPFLLWDSLEGDPNETFTTVGVLVLLVLCGWVLVRLFRAFFRQRASEHDARDLLLLIPGMLLIAGSMTSGNTIPEAFAPVSMLVLLAPISLPGYLRGTLNWRHTAFLAVLSLMVISAAIYKSVVPYRWQHFVDGSVFVDRQWYRHPLYGPMYIDRNRLRFVQDICRNIAVDGPPAELLSLQNPYPNYFCGVKPWHNYVQTWYDTTSPQTIDILLGELRSAPSKWIVYQRSIDTMAAHERFFTGGKPLPHRRLDRFIMDRIAQGNWTVVQREEFESADWIVIRTHP